MPTLGNNVVVAQPHGLWIWRLANLQSNYMDLLQRCGIKRVYLKILDGNSKPVFWGFQCSATIVKSFSDHGIEVWGWGFHYGAPDFSDELDGITKGLSFGLAT